MALRTRVAREARFLILGFGLGGGSSSLPRGANFDAMSEWLGHRLQIYCTWVRIPLASPRYVKVDHKRV